jgi:hypothetical protein
MSKDEALKLALGALECKDGWGSSIRSQKEKAITTIKQALAAPVQEPVAWLYKADAEFDGKEWHDSIRVTTSKQVADWQGRDIQPLYTTPPAQPAVQDKRLKVKLGSQYGSDLNGHWFYLQPADEFADAALHTHTGAAAPEKGQP